MLVSSLRRSRTWRNLGLTLVLSAWLCHGTINCQEFEFLGEQDKKELDKILEITLKPSIRKSIIWETNTWSVDTGLNVGHDDRSYLPTDDAIHRENVDEESWTPKITFTWKEAEIHCVDKEKINNRHAVKITLNEESSCEQTMLRSRSIMKDICKANCIIEFYQEANSKQVIMSGQTTEDDVRAMAAALNNEKVKRKMNLKEAVPYWAKRPPTVLVALLVAGILLAALLIGGYILKNRRGHNAKGMKLADKTFHVDEENQGNTLVSVAPLPSQEPQAPKPSINGESPDGGKCQSPPTNGHQTKSPTADTEL